MNTNDNISELQFLKGIGPKKALALKTEGLSSYYDLVRYFPKSYIVRNNSNSIAKLAYQLKIESKIAFQEITLKSINLHTHNQVIGKIVKKRIIELGPKRKILKLELTDDSKSSCDIVFFNRVQFFDKIYSVGQLLFVSGIASTDKYSSVKFTHPDIEIIDEEEIELYQKDGIVPKYKLPDIFIKNYITQNVIRNSVINIFNQNLVPINENLPRYILETHQLMPIDKTFKTLHFPDSLPDLEKAKYRMKFEEVLLFELALLSLRNTQKNIERGIVIPKNTPSVVKLYKELPFKLTNDQIEAIRTIFLDFQSGKPMNRLLQGDVGSGKTLVAIFTMLAAIDSGYQVAIMAPTELLAEQHQKTMNKFLKDFGIHVELLVSSLSARRRREVYENISSGKANIICGTHSLFQSKVQFNKLAYIVIDEQHKFGVNQRAELLNIAKQSHFEDDVYPHVLVMSATPIPRTLSMTLYGDLDVSIIREKPANRKPIKTKVVFDQNRLQVYDFIKEQIQNGRQCYYVFPLVEKSEKLELKAATEFMEHLKTDVFPEFKVGLLHGQMFGYEKDDAMYDFLNQKYDILVSTVIIEVGIDVPNATIMVIENAERFGLSQLHQLRGRVGRSEHQSYSFLFTKNDYQFQIGKANVDTSDHKAAIIRLKAMESTNDGFEISEIDLQLRGPGNILGHRQSGLPDFQFIDIINDGDIISRTRRISEDILDKDPHLNSTENNLFKKALQQYVKDKNNYYRIA